MRFVYALRELDRTKHALVGGKGANLGELTKIGGINVPDGFCVSTEAFKNVISETSIDTLIGDLSDQKNAADVSRKVRSAIEGITIPRIISEQIIRHLVQFGEGDAYAVRSSATAEDLPTASFAGQQDTYLNIRGKEEILKHVVKCWASLFTERAVTYRIQNGFDHRSVHLSVVIQKMVTPQASGVMFTADPINSDRKVVSIDAGFGFGDALVSGLVNPDNYKVRDGKITAQQKNKGTLTDKQVLALEQVGRKIEAHFGSPQDIEWCLADDTIFIVQSRPITTLFPIPKANDEDNHVYVSVGHQQMMTDPFKPLGLSFWMLTTRAPMHIAAGRLFIDVTKGLASPGRENLLDVLGQLDPRIKDALVTVIERGDIINTPANDGKEFSRIKSNKGLTPADIIAQAGSNPTIASDLISQCENGIASAKQYVGSKSGPELFDAILEDLERLKKFLFDPQSLGLIMAPINAAFWLNENMKEWLGEKNVADSIAQSVKNNITSEMGLALSDVADAIRPYPEVVAYLQHTTDDNFLYELPKLKGGKKAQEAINSFLNRYGARCVGEIDITRTRWIEKPITIVPIIISNIKNLEPGESSRKFEQGLREFSRKENELLSSLKRLPDGEQKAAETKQMIDLVRNFAGYREYPKYAKICWYFVYKEALLKEAAGLVERKVIRKTEDIYYLSFEELREVVRTNTVDYDVIETRKTDYRHFVKLAPPRVITSDGEIVSGKFKREDLPANAIAGLPVSSGIIEGRARVILNIEDANIEDGDILVTAFTDPSWTPLFVSIKGLVTEVGGVMTHGAVIAREYGLPAVVGVDNATTLIKDGQRIRVNGTDGYIEVVR